MRSLRFKTAIAIVLSFSLGLHWLGLQSIAWAGMFVSFAQQASLQEAAKMTFDGQHLCRLCKFVNESKKSEEKQERQNPTAKLECSLTEGARFVFPSVSRQLCFGAANPLPLRHLAPPSPPPKTA